MEEKYGNDMSFASKDKDRVTTRLEFEMGECTRREPANATAACNVNDKSFEMCGRLHSLARKLEY